MLRTRSCVCGLMILLLGPSASDAAPAARSTATAPAAELDEKELRLAIAELDRSDPAVGYALSVRTTGQLTMVAGSLTMAAVILAAALETMVRRDDGYPVGPVVASAGVPAGLTIMISGIPEMISAPTFLRWYALHDEPPSRMARLRLLRRWELQLLRTRRDSALIGSAVLGAAGLLSAIVWASRDSRGFNGPLGGSHYYPADAATAIGFLTGGGVSAALGLLAHLEYDGEKNRPHRLWAAPSVVIAPAALQSSTQPPGVAVQAGLTIRF